MSVEFGISVDETLVEQIERPLEYSDSRSERIEELVRAGLVVEELIDDMGWAIDLGDERDLDATLRQAALDHERMVDEREG